MESGAGGVQIDTRKTGDPKLIDLVVTVKEKQTGTFQIGAGFSSYESFLLTAQISKDALVVFDRVAYGRKGLALAEARDGLCTVCHVRLRPQIFNEVRRNDSVIQCESCTRILYYVPARSVSEQA